jgi:VanZ family protein
MKKLTLWVLTIIWMVVIFILSSQTGKQSAELSSEVADTIMARSKKVKTSVKHVVKSTNAVAVQKSTAEKKTVKPSPADVRKERVARRKFDQDVRSFAHSYNYCILAILFFFALRQHKVKTWKVLFSTIIFCLLYAASDEYHQSFVPGRGIELQDYIHDLIGTLIGCTIALLILGTTKLAKKINNRQTTYKPP